MKILIAPNTMKGSLSAFDFADIVEKALLRYSDDFEITKIPMADGGDLTGEVLERNLRAQRVEVNVRGPLGKVVKSKYAFAGKTAIIEMADASGMKLLSPDELNPLLTSSYGTGELIGHAIDSGCSGILLAIGGSATVDGGLGMMHALGFVMLDKDGNKLEGRGEDLNRLVKIEISDILQEVNIRIICDVDNPLLGEQGAAAVFGPQKGATPEMVNELETGLENLAKILRRESGKDLGNIAGVGAAGGLSLPLLAFGRAEIVPGADFICQQLDLEKWIRWADVVITGEGKIDSQTLNNKAPFAVAKLARLHNKPVLAIGGSVAAEASSAFDAVFSLARPGVSTKQAIQYPRKYLFQTASEVARSLKRYNK